MPALLWERIQNVVFEAVPVDSGGFVITDPVSGLVTDGYAFGDPKLTDTYFSHFYLKREKYSLLDQRAEGKVLSLVSSNTRGRPEEDPLYRDLLRREGYKHMARVSFVSGRYYWGGLCAIRGADTPDFNKHELTFLRALAEPVGAALRRSVEWELALTPVAPDESLPDAGVMLLDAKDRVLFQTDGVKSILEDITGRDLPDVTGRINRTGMSLPLPLQGACARLRLALKRKQSSINPSVTMKGWSQWWTISATLPELDMSDEVATVLILSRAHPRDTASVLLAAYDLTQREEEIVRLIRLGLSTAAIAHQLIVSQYTVQDHLKNIFAKVGVGSRGELMAILFREESPVGRSLSGEPRIG